MEEMNMKELIKYSRELRARLLADPHRPVYHTVTPEGLCGPFDPNAALYWKGLYHLMYIVQTEEGHCFAHISSKDLVHWRNHPLALEPDGDKLDEPAGPWKASKSVLAHKM